MSLELRRQCDDGIGGVGQLASPTCRSQTNPVFSSRGPRVQRHEDESDESRYVAAVSKVRGRRYGCGSASYIGLQVPSGPTPLNMAAVDGRIIRYAAVQRQSPQRRTLQISRMETGVGEESYSSDDDSARVTGTGHERYQIERRLSLSYRLVGPRVPESWDGSRCHDGHGGQGSPAVLYLVSSLPGR